MKRVITSIFMLLMPAIIVLAKSENTPEEVNDKHSSAIEEVLKASYLKVRYEAVSYLDREIKKENEKKGSVLRLMSKSGWNRFSQLIKGENMFEEAADESGNETAGQLVAVDVNKPSAKELNEYIKWLDCTPEKALEDYKALIEDIKSDKKRYLTYLDAEIAKGEASDYADRVVRYSFQNPMSSFISSYSSMSGIEYLKIFREFVLEDGEEVLPNMLKVSIYNECGCKISDRLIFDIEMTRYSFYKLEM